MKLSNIVWVLLVLLVLADAASRQVEVVNPVYLTCRCILRWPPMQEVSSKSKKINLCTLPGGSMVEFKGWLDP